MKLVVLGIRRVRAWEESGIVPGTTIKEGGHGHRDPAAISWRLHIFLDHNGSWMFSLAKFLLFWVLATTEHRIPFSCGGLGNWSSQFHPLLPTAGWSRIAFIPNQGGLGESFQPPMEEQG